MAVIFIVVIILINLGLGGMSKLKYSNIGTLTVLPNEYMDGFYIAKIRKL